MDPDTARSAHFVTSGGLRLHTLRWGRDTDPLVVLLHGAGANAHWWDHVAPALAPGHHLIALDFRGHGESDFPEELVPGAFSLDLEALLAELDAGPPILVGHSLGAGVALEYAAHHAQVERLVLLDLSRGASQTARRAARLALSLSQTYATREKAVARFRPLPRTRRIAEPLRRAIAEHSVAALDDGRFGYKFDARWFGVRGRSRPDPAQVACPTLLIRGAESNLLSAEAARALVAALPQGRLVEIAEAGHHVQLDRPAETVAAIAAFLAREAAGAGMLGAGPGG